MASYIRIAEGLDKDGELRLEAVVDMDDDIQIYIDLSQFLDMAKAFGFAVIKVGKDKNHD